MKWLQKLFDFVFISICNRLGKIIAMQELAEINEPLSGPSRTACGVVRNWC